MQSLNYLEPDVLLLLVSSPDDPVPSTSSVMPQATSHSVFGRTSVDFSKLSVTVCMSVQAHLLLAETVGAATVLGLGHHTFLPDVYLDNLVSLDMTSLAETLQVHFRPSQHKMHYWLPVDPGCVVFMFLFMCCSLLQEWSPLFGQPPRGAGSQGGKRTSALKKWWADKGSVIKTLALASRIVRLLHNLMDTMVGNKTLFLKRTSLMNSVVSASGEFAQHLFSLFSWLLDLMFVCLTALHNSAAAGIVSTQQDMCAKRSSVVIYCQTTDRHSLASLSQRCVPSST